MRHDAWAGALWRSCQSQAAHSCGLLNHSNSFGGGTFKLNAKFDTDLLLHSVILSVTATQYACSLNGICCPHRLVQWSRHCSSMCIPVHSPWLPGYIGFMQIILIILTMAGLFLDRPHINMHICNMYKYIYIYIYIGNSGFLHKGIKLMCCWLPILWLSNCKYLIGAGTQFLFSVSPNLWSQETRLPGCHFGAVILSVVYKQCSPEPQGFLRGGSGLQRGWGRGQLQAPAPISGRDLSLASVLCIGLLWTLTLKYQAPYRKQVLQALYYTVLPLPGAE